MARTQATLAYEFNIKLLHAKHKALDTLNNVLDAMKAKEVDPRLIAQARMAAHTVLRVPSLGVRTEYARERESQDPIEAPTARASPSVTPTPLNSVTSSASAGAASPVPLADEVRSRSVKWLERQLRRTGGTPNLDLSLDSC